MVGYNGWLWTQAIDARQREQDLRAIYAYRADAPALLKQYNVSYVVIGPGERNNLKANEAAFRAAYPAIITTPQYRIYRVDSAAP
jgi:uncharacterized membrane protein